MTRHPAILAAAVFAVTAGSAASAHHSHPYVYDQCKSITIEGRVESVDWKDPHTLIIVKLDNGTEYTVDWAPLMGLTRDRIIDSAKTALVTGARVSVTGAPIRTAAEIREKYATGPWAGRFPEFKGEVNPNTLDPRSIRRVDASFNWALPPSANPPDCSRK
jgi:hypothetical protein